MKKWIEAMRLRTLPVSISGVLAGISCAVAMGSFKIVPAVLCLLFAMLAQIASNFGNEYYDEKDEFPLLYTNIYNNYAKTDDKRKGITCVYRIHKEDKTSYKEYTGIDYGTKGG